MTRASADRPAAPVPSGSLEPSHVMLAIGLPHEIAHGSLRLTLGDANTEQDMDRVLNILPKVCAKLRDMSPLYHKSGKEGKTGGTAE